MHITISRQYSAGSSEVARRIAETLGWTVLDDELVEQVAQRSGLSPDEVKDLEERSPSFLERVAQTNALAFPDLMLGPSELVAEPEQAKLARITRGLIEELGRQNRLVLVGRAAAAVLGRRSDALHVKLVAGREWRIQRTVARLGVPATKAAQIVDDRDRNRLRYTREFFGRDWADPVGYHLTLNTERLGFDVAAAAVVAVVRALGW